MMKVPESIGKEACSLMVFSRWMCNNSTHALNIFHIFSTSVLSRDSSLNMILSKGNVIYHEHTCMSITRIHVHACTLPSGHADQSSGRLQLDWKHADFLKTSWCLLQGYVTIKYNILKPPWWRLQHVMFIRPQEDHPTTSLEDVFTPLRTFKTVN